MVLLQVAPVTKALLDLQDHPEIRVKKEPTEPTVKMVQMVVTPKRSRWTKLKCVKLASQVLQVLMGLWVKRVHRDPKEQLVFLVLKENVVNEAW